MKLTNKIDNLMEEVGMLETVNKMKLDTLIETNKVLSKVEKLFDKMDEENYQKVEEIASLIFSINEHISYELKEEFYNEIKR